MSSSPITTWEELLEPNSPWGCVAIGPDRALDNLARQTPGNVEARIIRGVRCANSSTLFSEWAAALQFPYYFGHNWSAFDECINDLEWMRTERLIIFVSRADVVLADEPQRFGPTLMAIFARGRAYAWRAPKAVAS